MAPKTDLRLQIQNMKTFKATRYFYGKSPETVRNRQESPKFIPNVCRQRKHIFFLEKSQRPRNRRNVLGLYWRFGRLGRPS
jgi:hypothetical protein